MFKNSLLINRFNLRENASPLQHNIIIELYKNGPLTRRELVKKLNILISGLYE